MGRLLGGHADLDVLARDILEQRRQIYLLLEVRAKRHPRLLSDDCDHRRVIELRVIQPVHQMDRSGTGGRHADPDLAGELGVCAGREGRDFLVAGLDELDLVLKLVKRSEQPVYPVTRVAIDAGDAPLLEALEHERSDGLRHGSLLALAGAWTARPY